MGAKGRRYAPLRGRKMAHQLFGYDDIHALLRGQKPQKALRRLLTPDGALRAGFEDKSHAWYCVGCAHFNLGNYQGARSAFRNALTSGSQRCAMSIGHWQVLRRRGKTWSCRLGIPQRTCNDPDRTGAAKLILTLANAHRKLVVTRASSSAGARGWRPGPGRSPRSPARTSPPARPRACRTRRCPCRR